MDARRVGQGAAPLWLAAVLLVPLERTSPPIATDSPIGLMRCFEAAYEGRSLEEYAALFTRDFRFHFKDEELRARWPDGWTRADEILSARHLFEGFRDAGGVRRPPALDIELSLRPLSIQGDPDMPESSFCYRVALAPSVRLAICTEDGGYLVDDQPHVFHLVRGDVADLDPSQPADAGHWYIRRWVESPGLLAGADPDGVAGALEDGPAGVGTPSNPAVATGIAPRIALAAAFPNPARDRLTLVLTASGRGEAAVEIFDVAGRIRMRRPLGRLAPGPHRVALAFGGELGAGVYWARVIEDRQAAVRRFVLVP